jgi:21S rRNA (GM2251-2'-O)-methyltransferase
VGGYTAKPARFERSYEDRGSRYSDRREQDSDNGSRLFKASNAHERPARPLRSFEERGSKYPERRSFQGMREEERPGRSNTEKSSKYAGRHERDFHDVPRQFRDTKQPFERKRDSQGQTSERQGRNSGFPSTLPFGRPGDKQSYGSRTHDRPSESSEAGRYPSLSPRKGSTKSKFGPIRSTEERSYGSRSHDRLSETGASDRYPSPPFGKWSSDSQFDNTGSTDKRRSDRSTVEPKSFDRSTKYRDLSPAGEEWSSSSGPKFTQIADNRIPLSIPYTTPASEFLYGASVVEAALSSRREPRRKLYKFYIYTGENREDPDQDARLERLAKRSGVEVIRAGNEWIRVMDKMSAGRPHNGYILEASPLPRLPVTSLGQLTRVDGQDGFRSFPRLSITRRSRSQWHF